MCIRDRKGTTRHRTPKTRDHWPPFWRDGADQDEMEYPTQKSRKLTDVWEACDDKTLEALYLWYCFGRRWAASATLSHEACLDEITDVRMCQGDYEITDTGLPCREQILYRITRFHRPPLQGILEILLARESSWLTEPGLDMVVNMGILDGLHPASSLRAKSLLSLIHI